MAVTWLRNPRALLEYIRGSLLFAPGLSVLAAIALGLLLARPQFAVDGSSAPFFGGGAASAQGLLQAITTAVITVTTLTFSLTVITLQLASSQYSPRLLRGFLRDRGTQAVLSILLSTAAYSLIVLRSIRLPEGGGDGFVPELAVSIAVLLAIVSIFALVYFLDHVTTEIRVDTMLAKVRRSTSETIERVYPAQPSQPVPGDTPDPPDNAMPLTALRSGYLQDVNTAGISKLASEHQVSLLLRPRVGDSVVEGTPVGWVWSSARKSDPLAAHNLAGPIDQHLTIGFERTAAQDVAFGFRQLTDVATRALSPSINDPTTATHATVHLTHLLCLLAPRPMGDVVIVDAHGPSSCRFPRHSFSDVLDDSTEPLRRYGNTHLDVVRSTFRMLNEVQAVCVSSDRRDLVRRQAVLLLSDCRQVHAAHNLREVEQLAAPLVAT